VSCKVNVTSRY